MSTLLPTNQTPLVALFNLAEGREVIAQNLVVDLLLDEYAANADVTVRTEIAATLTRIARRRLLTAAEVRECAATIHAADQVESAFAHLLLAS
jgi:hypothetical protein